MLQKLPERLDVLRSSGVAATVGERVTAHPNRAVREAAERLRRRWADEPEQAPAAAPDQAQAPQNGHGRHIGATADAGGARPPTPGSEEEAAEVMDPDLVAKLAAAEEVRATWRCFWGASQNQRGGAPRSIFELGRGPTAFASQRRHDTLRDVQLM